MSFLHFLEGLRTDWLTAFFSAVTVLGQETVFVAVLLVVLWCAERRVAYRLFAVFMTSTLCAQVIKTICRVPRPWLRDPTLHPVPGAQEGAEGWSFPSGHSQAAAALYGSTFLFGKRRWPKVAAVGIILLVTLSRLYLGVHTPADVIAGVCVGALTLVGFHFLFRALEKTRLGDIWVLIGLTVAGAITVPAALLLQAEETTLAHACKLLGSTVGMLLVALWDRRHPTDTAGRWWQQGLKILIGLPLFFLLKTLLKAPLQTLLGVIAGDGVRYLILLVMAGAVYPLWFRLLRRAKTE